MTVFCPYLREHASVVHLRKHWWRRQRVVGLYCSGCAARLPDDRHEVKPMLVAGGRAA